MAGIRGSDESIGRRLTGFMVVGFLALLAVGLAAAWTTSRGQTHIRWLAHSYEVQNAILDARQTIERGETSRRGYLLAPRQTDFLAIYRNSANAVPLRLKHLRRLVRDNPEQTALYRLLLAQMQRLAAIREHSLDLIAAGRVVEARGAFDTEHSAVPMADIRETLDRMSAAEQKLLDVRERDVVDSERMFYAVLVLSAVLLLIVAITSLATVLGYTRDLGRSRDALASLNAHLEEMVADRTQDLTRANEEIQRFAYIVSHDLRSPLVNVMGFTAELEAAAGSLRTLVDRVEAEAPALASPDAALAAREDLPEAIGFIRSSTQRMDRLINAILQLSRYGRRVLSPERLDVSAIVDQVRDTLAHRLAEAEAVLEVSGRLPDVVSDRFSIEQVLSNLIENAVKYLRPGVPGRIVVSGRYEGTRVVYEIADNGRGIAASDHARVFDLFRRSGAQDRPGEGIGLATVRALVFRLGGLIDLTSTLGEGTTFRLSFPRTLAHSDNVQDTPQ
ncbi:sensor histidine kinase [Sphingomonas adhaesiva]|uniref:sensor histidine kinase n=1 Tax=Sphingomonas adhaesiva TaxID=28212 RepID=UPI002FF8C1C5